ncbi:MAG TPA: acyl-protein synthetase [Thermoanaerobaculia bacterium]|nr:acyl-protein synthetase [Thermoanaerobaculia bacterium]
MNPVDSIRAYLADPRPALDEFEALALAAFAYEFERIPAYRALCERAGRTPATVGSWRDVPMIPAAAFASVELATDPPRETFRSSGTLGGERSVHRHPFPELYRAAIDATFPRFCLPRGERPAMLALMPPRAVAPDSSLGFMIAHVVERFGGAGSAYGFGARGVEIGACRSWLGAAQRGGRPALVLATAFALADLVERLERMNLHFRLPAGSAIFETGGFKGRTREIAREELLARAERWLGVPATAVVSEYGMTELTSQAYTETLTGGEPGRFVAPPWLRARALDPATLAERPAGATGLLAFFDLANVGSALHVLTEDLGAVDAGGAFRLAGRAAEADLRGCSLLAEELQHRS